MTPVEFYTRISEGSIGLLGEAAASCRLDGDTQYEGKDGVTIIVPDEHVEQVRAAMGGQP